MTAIQIRDGNGDLMYVEVSGSGTESEPYKPVQDVYIQDQETDIIDLYMMMVSDTFTLASSTAVDDTVISLTTGHSVTQGQVICIQEGVNTSQFEVLSVSGDDITIDSPIDKVYSTSANCCNGTYNAAVDGSTTAKTFRITPSGLQDGVTWHITSIAITMLGDTVMDDGTFGSSDALTNGCVLRLTNGEVKNLFNVKTNGEIKLRRHVCEYAAKPPAGTGYGFQAVREFAGQKNNGVVIALHSTTDDELQLIVQDDLTDNTIINICAFGHVTEG